MRGLYSSKTKIRHQIFTEIAKLAYSDMDPAEGIEHLPYKILPGEIATYRDSIFLERAVVGERVRVAMGMSLRDVSQQAPLSEGVEASAIEEKYYEPPLINVIKFACNSCVEKKVLVTEGCQGCLEHPCIEVCPKKTIYMKDGHSHIHQEDCIKCGKCADACPYNAIIKQERPCSKACGVGAIKSDEHGRAEIDQDKCVSCGMCLVSCPFSAIVDKGQIYQTIQAIKSDTPVYAIVAPAIAGQFEGLKNTQIRSAFKALGFTSIREVAIGADLCTLQEAEDFLEEVPEKIPFMGTSCCPAWSVMVKKNFPDQAECISMALTPMVLTARLIKQKEPDCKIVFVGPCAAKKLEASRRTIRSYVDFVLTFEEVQGMFEAKGVDFSTLPEEEPLARASADGRGFAASGGVAAAVVKAIKHIDPDREVKVMSADGLANCKKMIAQAKAGKYNGYLLEGMACPGGCIAGAGTIANPKNSAVALNKMMGEATFEECIDTKYQERLETLEHLDL